jgi:putative membrane-bound dehydrogenase-like protein
VVNQLREIEGIAVTRNLVLVSAVIFGVATPALADEKPLKLLFLGDNGHHKPAERFRQLQPVLAKRGIDLNYTDKADALSEKVLSGYDGLVIYANTTKITPEQEKALIDYVESGHGFIPLHCASYCFLNSPKYVDLVGAQFKSHNTGTFRTVIAEPDHPVMKSFKGFESWDETYVHTKHNEKDRTVLEYRKEGDSKEPWTWVRTQGKGRVFYTAWGHDDKTWGNPGFQNLVERGIRWAVGKDPGVVPAFGFNDKPEMTPKRKDVKPFEYVDANIPFYAPRGGGTRPKQMQKPLDVAESVKHFVTPVDFEMRPFVTEEKLGPGKPICMTWDERGRLWVGMSVDYPNERKPEGEGRDRIVICEDTDGDGVCDTVTTFAEKLSIPTSLLCCYGGVIVHQMPHTLFLKDTKGTGKADLRQVLFTGWGTGDTHAGPSNLRYGFDNWLYGMVGYSAFFGTVAGERLNFRQGLYRFKVEREPLDEHKLKVTKLEFLRSTSNNSWGVGFTEEGLLFGSTANGCPSVFMPIPNRYYEKVRGLTPGVLPSIAADNHIEPITDKVRQVDFHGGFTAAAGHEIYTARVYPREYWNRVAFISEPTGHLTATMVLTPDGTSFKTKYGWNLVASDDEWSAPIDAHVGPDGHVWVIDWYNYIVQHNPTPPGFTTGKGNAYETNLRDKKHGRIYRVVYTKAKQEKPFTLKDAKPEELVAALKHPTMTWRLHAQRLLVERGKSDVSEALVKLVEDKTVDATGLNAGAVHALWTLEGIGELAWNPPTYDDQVRVDRHARRLIQVALLDNPSAAVRRAATQTLQKVLDRSAYQKIAQLAVNDNEAQVRLAALLSFAENGATVKARDAISELLRRNDVFSDWQLRDALTIAACANLGFIEDVLKDKTPLSTAALRVVELAMSNAASGVARSSIGADNLIAPQFLRLMARADPATAAAVVTGLASGWPSSQAVKVTADHEEAIGKLAANLPLASRAQLLRLAQIWGVKGVAEQLKEISAASLKTATDEQATDEQRVTAAKQVIEFRTNDDDAVASLLAMISARSSPSLLTGIFEAVGNSQAPSLGKQVVAKLPSLSPAGRAAALRLLLSRPAATGALLDAFEKGELNVGDLALDQKQALASHPDAKIAARAKALLAKGGGLPDADRQKVIDEWLDVTKAKGDPEIGKAVFKNQCAKCHMHGTEGARIGPDLTGVAVHSKEHLLIDILDPNRSVEGNFRVWKVTTADGKSFSGLLAAETKTSVEIIDAEAKKHVIQRDDIEKLTSSPKSLMPDGFEKQFKEKKDLIDLLEFLTQKGKYLPIPLDKAATVVSTKGMFYDEAAPLERLIFRDWNPKTFDGVPFNLVDPQGDKVRNAILLHSDIGKVAASMPKSVTLPCNTATKAIHLLSGVSGWGYSFSEKGTVSAIVRLHYEDGKTEDHELKNGEHFADYIRRVDVPGSKFAFALRGQQIRYLAVTPKREAVIKEIEFVKGPDRTAPVIMAVTVEPR